MVLEGKGLGGKKEGEWEGGGWVGEKFERW